MSEQNAAPLREHIRSGLNVVGVLNIVFGLVALGGFVLLPYLESLIRQVVGFPEFSEVSPSDAELNRTITLLYWCVFSLCAVHLVVYVVTGIGFLRRRWYGICMATSVLSLLAFPVGTALGVFGIYVLVQDDAKLAFDQAAKSGEDTPSPSRNA